MREEIIAGGGLEEARRGKETGSGVDRAEWILLWVPSILVSLWIKTSRNCDLPTNRNCISNFSKFIVNASLISRTEAHIRFK